jgi:hypothetical protein
MDVTVSAICIDLVIVCTNFSSAPSAEF